MTDAEEMVELMAYASPSKVAAALGVSKTSTGKWAKGENVTPYRLRQVRNLLRPPAPAQVPDWAERILAGVMAIEADAEISDAEVAQAQARAAAYLAVAQSRRQRPADDDGRAERAS